MNNAFPMEGGGVGAPESDHSSIEADRNSTSKGVAKLEVFRRYVRDLL